MNKRTKGFLIALVAAAGIAAIFGGKGGGKFFVQLIFLLCIVWIARLAFLRLWRLFRPVREVVMPATDEALRSVGLGTFVDAGRHVNQTIDKAAGVEPDHKSHP